MVTYAQRVFLVVWLAPVGLALVNLLMVHIFPFPVIQGGLHQLGWLAGVLTMLVARAVLLVAVGSNHPPRSKVPLLRCLLYADNLGQALIAAWLAYRFLLFNAH